MAQPLVSVWCITYNHVDFIGEALSSALEQDYPKLEVVVADDGSTDGTVEVIGDYSQKYPDRLIVLPGRTNQGVEGILSNANRALRACKGKYVAFLEGDDVFLPHKITKQVEWLEADERRVLCGHDVEVFDSKTGKPFSLWSDVWPMRSGRGAQSIVRGTVPFGTAAVMVRASAIPPHGFDERLRVVLDWKLWIDCLASGGRFGYIEGVYARYRRHEHNITSSHFQIRQDDQFTTLALVESRYPHLASCCKHSRGSLFYRMGIQCLLRGERVLATVHLMNAVRQRLHWKTYLALLLTILPDRMLASLLAHLTSWRGWVPGISCGYRRLDLTNRS